MTFLLRPDNGPQMAKYSEFYRRRGCKVIWYSQDETLAVMVPYVCPELKVAGRGGFCKIYDKRPQMCREYDGRWDPHMREYCQLPVDREERNG